MSRRYLPVNKAWRAAPLPFEFHAALDEGDWLKALTYYHAHPYHCPPVDTFDLLKSIIYKTGITSEQIKRRFSDKVRLSMTMEKRKAEQVDWEVFWNALNNGDSKTISMALTGAKISNVAGQIGVAEACAVLLKSSGRDWRHKLINSVPFGTVTRSNLITVALNRNRWDLACEMMATTKVTRNDMVGLWPSIAQLPWAQCLSLLSQTPKTVVPYVAVIPHLLDSGCDLSTLTEYLEAAKVLGDSAVVAPLLSRAIDTKNWQYVQKCMDHLADIGTISSMAYQTFNHLCEKHGIENVARSLLEKGIPLHSISIELLEELSIR